MLLPPVCTFVGTVKEIIQLGLESLSQCLELNNDREIQIYLAVVWSFFIHPAPKSQSLISQAIFLTLASDLTNNVI